jgi:hypothetical protein
MYSNGFVVFAEGLNMFTLESIDTGDNINLPCEISSSHGGEYDVQSCLLGYTAV